MAWYLDNPTRTTFETLDTILPRTLVYSRMQPMCDDEPYTASDMLLRSPSTAQHPVGIHVASMLRSRAAD